MKKLITALSVAAVLATSGVLTMLHSKADMKVETSSFCVSMDRSVKPSAYCRQSDGSPVSRELSSSENFCITGSANGHMTSLTCEGLPAYCIGTHRQNAPSSLMQVTRLSDIPYDSAEYGAIFRMAAAGASTGHTEYGLNGYDLYYVTQCAVRSYLYNLNPDSLAFYDETGNYNESMTEEYRRIFRASSEESAPFESTLIISGGDCEPEKEYTEDKCYFRYGPYIPYSEFTDFACYTITGAEDNPNVIISAEEDISTADPETEYSSGTPFYVYLDSAYEEEITLNINSETHISRYDPTVYLAANSSFQSIFQLRIQDYDELLAGNLTLKNTNTSGDIQLDKKFLASDSEINDINLIAQPRFTVKNENGKYVSGISSDGIIIFDHFSDEPVEYALSADSEIYISGLPVGEYSIYEIKGAEGYEARESEIFISNTHDINTCEFINESVTTTTTAVTTTVTTTPVSTTPLSTTSEYSETTVTSVTTMPEITFTLNSETTFITDITEESKTETETVTSTGITSDTTAEVSINTPRMNIVSVKTPSVPRLPGTPKTGDSRYPLPFILAAMSLAAVVFSLTRKK